MNILVTGGAGFIGSNFIYYQLRINPGDRIVCADALKYAGNIETLSEAIKNPNFRFALTDITDRKSIYKLFEEEKPDIVVNFAAESHVDRSIEDYDTKTLKVTEEMVDELKKKVENLGYDKLQNIALEYISDNTWELYKNKPEVISGTNATRSGNTITIKNWQNVVAYEVKDQTGKLVFVSSGETTSSTTDMFTLSGNWDSSYKLYAVSAAGKRTEIPVGN